MFCARHINSKFEIEKLPNIANMKIKGERDEDVILEMEIDSLEPKRLIYLNNGLRVDDFARRSKETFVSIPKLILQVRQEVGGIGGGDSGAIWPDRRLLL